MDGGAAVTFKNTVFPTCSNFKTTVQQLKTLSLFSFQGLAVAIGPSSIFRTPNHQQTQHTFPALAKRPSNMSKDMESHAQQFESARRTSGDDVDEKAVLGDEWVATS